jgi:hypothetical protein
MIQDQVSPGNHHWAGAPIGSYATYTQSLRVTWSMATTTAGQQSFVANLNSLSWTFMKVSPTSWKIV